MSAPMRPVRPPRRDGFFDPSEAPFAGRVFHDPGSRSSQSLPLRLAKSATRMGIRVFPLKKGTKKPAAMPYRLLSFDKTMFRHYAIWPLLLTGKESIKQPLNGQSEPSLLIALLTGLITSLEKPGKLWIA